MRNFFLKSLVYGGTDGIITMFNIISGVEGAKLNHLIIFLIGFGTLIGDAISMGFSDFLSFKADNKYQKNIDNNIKIVNDPKKNGIITFISFIMFGLIPLSCYLLYSKYSNNKYTNTFLSTIISLFILGSVQSIFTKEKWYKSGLYISFYGIIASSMSFGIGRTMSKLFPQVKI